jgi:hypothetical protein
MNYETNDQSAEIPEVLKKTTTNKVSDLELLLSSEDEEIGVRMWCPSEWVRVEGWNG